MSCEAINSYLATNSSVLGPWIYSQNSFAKSPELALIKREQFPEGIGYDFRIWTGARIAPTTNITWTSASALSADGESTDCGACANSFSAVDGGYTTRTCTLYKHEFKSRMLCVEDLRTPWEVKAQLNHLRSELGNYVKRVWEQRARQDMFLYTKYKVVCDGTLDGNATSTMAATYPAACPTHILTQQTLDYYFALLYRDGATDAMGGYQLPLVVGPETSMALKMQDSNIRQDYNYGKPLELMNGLFASTTTRNFAHVITPFPRRFNCAGGTFTEVPPYTSESKTILTGAEISSAYNAAPYEEATIWVPEVMHHLVPRPISSPGGGASFDPVSYTGEYRWANIADQDGTNVFNSMGRWYGRIFVSPMPVKPELGVSFVFRRCQEAQASLPSPCNYS